MLCIGAQSREGEFLDGREVAGGVSLSDATVVLTERDIKYPVHGFNAPVGSCSVSELLYRLYAGTDDKVAPIDADLALDLLLGLDHADGGKLLPSVTHGLAHPRHVRNKGCPPGFDPAMILLNRGACLYVDVAEVKRGGGIEELDDRLRQILLVVLHRQNMIAPLSDDFLDYFSLAAQRIDGQMQPVRTNVSNNALIAASSLPLPAVPSCPSDTPSVVA